MDGLSFLLTFVTVAFLLCILGVNFSNTFGTVVPKVSNEGFEDKKELSNVGIRIRAVLDPMVQAQGETLCSLYDTIRKNMIQNEKTGQNISDEEAKVRVEKALALQIPGGPLPCPLLRYPQGNVTDIEWLNWLQRVPPDFGARVVFMAVYAQDMLGSTEQKLKDALGGKGTPPTQEGFAPICPPDIAMTRRAERARKSEQACDLPEDVGPERIQEQIDVLLKTIVEKKTSLLKEKKIDPAINIESVLQKAKRSQAYLEKQEKAADEGTLSVNIPNAT